MMKHWTRAGAHGARCGNCGAVIAAGAPLLELTFGTRHSPRCEPCAKVPYGTTPADGYKAGELWDPKPEPSGFTAAGALAPGAVRTLTRGTTCQDR